MAIDVTQQYHFPPASLTGPPAEELSPEQLRAVAQRACTSVTDLRALQGSPAHLLRLCEMLGALHTHVVDQEADLEATRNRLSAAGRMVSGARDQAALVRHSLGLEVAAHCETKRLADQEHELRIAAEEELRRVVEAHARDSKRLSRAIRLIGQLSDQRPRQGRWGAGKTPGVLQVSLEGTRPGVDTLLDLSEADACPDDLDNEKTVVDPQDVYGGLEYPRLVRETGEDDCFAGKAKSR